MGGGAQIHRQQGDIISPLIFFRNRESRLKIKFKIHNSHLYKFANICNQARISRNLDGEWLLRTVQQPMQKKWRKGRNISHTFTFLCFLRVLNAPSILIPLAIPHSLPIPSEMLYNPDTENVLNKQLKILSFCSSRDR
jgi:hypothetical protein